jgi:RHS Repeat
LPEIWVEVTLDRVVGEWQEVFRRWSKRVKLHDCEPETGTFYLSEKSVGFLSGGYNAVGSLTTETDPLGNVTTTAYDNLQWAGIWCRCRS